MLKKLILSAALALVAVHASAQCTAVILNKRTKLTYTAYDRHYEKDGKLVVVYDSISDEGDHTEAKVLATQFTAKGKKASEMLYTVKCNEKRLIIGQRAFFSPSESKKDPENNEENYEGDNVEFPFEMEVGMKLNPADMQQNLVGAGISVKIEEREVVAEDSLDSPFGKIKCYKITATSSFKVNTQAGIGTRGISGGGSPKIKTTRIDWFSPVYGIIKSELYTKRGKLVEAYELTKVE